MGRKKVEIDELALLKMREAGKTRKEIAAAFGISTATVSRRIAELKHQGLMTKYRELQGLRLTELQADCLGAIAAKDLSKASLLELAKAFDILHKAEERARGKERIWVGGMLLDYLLEIEKEQKSLRSKDREEV